MRIFLKVKIKSLVAEAAIIRKEEGRFRDYLHPVRSSLRVHREKLGEEMRLSFLAYAYLRNRPYRSIEATTKHPLTEEKVNRLAKMIARFAAPDQMKSLDNLLKSWLETPEGEAQAAARANAREEWFRLKRVRRENWRAITQQLEVPSVSS